MIQLRSEGEIEKIGMASRVVAKVLEALRESAKPGCAARDLDLIAARLIEKENAKPAFKGYMGYPANICVSVNSEVIHGIPGAYRLKEGDIAGLDVGVELQGYYGDGAITVAVGSVSPSLERLISVTKEALNNAIAKAVTGNRIGDISYAIQSHAEKNGFSVVRDYVGHGIGTSIHEEPSVPNFGSAGTGLRLKPGMVLAIETMVNSGGSRVKVLDDKWTVVTADNKPSAHFEHTIAVTENGPRILTKI